MAAKIKQKKKITRAKIQRNKDQGQKEIWRTSPRDPRDLGITVVSRKRRRTEKESMRIKEIKADFFFLQVSVNGTGLCSGVTEKVCIKVCIQHLKRRENFHAHPTEQTESRHSN